MTVDPARYASTAALYDSVRAWGLADELERTMRDPVFRRLRSGGGAGAERSRDAQYNGRHYQRRRD